MRAVWILSSNLQEESKEVYFQLMESYQKCWTIPWTTKKLPNTLRDLILLLPAILTSLDKVKISRAHTVHTMLVDLSAFIIYIITSDLYFHINIQCLKLRSPSNDEMHNQIPIQRCIVMLNEKIRHSTRTKTLDAYVQSGEEILRSQHVFDWTHVVESLSSVWFNDGFGENHTFLKCRSFRSAWQE